MRIFGLLLIIVSGMSWAWMLGAFSFFNELASLEGNIATWFDPGVQPFLAFASVVYGFVGAVMLTGINPLALMK